MSNFLEAPNGGRAGRNQLPAGRFSLRERCDCRGNNPPPAAKDSRAVALRTRENPAKTIVLDANCNVSVRPEGQANEAGTSREICPISHCVHHSTAVRLF
jgi:hypothetical protein